MAIPASVLAVINALEQLNEEGRKYMRQNWHSIVFPRIKEDGVIPEYVECAHCRAIESLEVYEFLKYVWVTGYGGEPLKQELCVRCRSYCDSCEEWYANTDLQYHVTSESPHRTIERCSTCCKSYWSEYAEEHNHFY
jgi:hypothetical protein